MEEDSGVKAPVTRLRRRLSVEQSDDVKSPGPATPTKKRGGRLAAKPQLELIDEHAADITPSKRTTRKTSVKEAVEATDEKPATPSRRSTRIKSNTSIVSETTQSYDSPRAKRAARRTSQVGSDSEAPVTPIRQTRRTRKDSSSSVEKLDVTLVGKPHITEVIIEEEIKSDDTSKPNDSSPTTSIRKSPRLKEKQQDRKNIDKSQIEITNDEDSTSSNHNRKTRKSVEATPNIDASYDSHAEDILNTSKQNRKKDRKSIENVNNEAEATKKDVDNSKESLPNARKSLDKLSNNESLQIDSKQNQKRVSSHDIGIYDFSEDTSNFSKENHINERKSTDKSFHDIEITVTTEPKLNNSKQKERKSIEKNVITETVVGNSEEKANDKPEMAKETSIHLESEKQNENSDSSFLMIRELDKKPKRKSSIINKSASALDNDNNLQNKRQRTKSWTVTSLTQDKEGVFYSDNETTKKKLKKRSSKDFNTSIQSNHSGSGDNEYNIGFNMHDTNEKSLMDSTSLNKSLKTNNLRNSKEFMTPEKISKTENKTETADAISPQGNKENIRDSATPGNLDETPEKFFEKDPTAILKSTVYFEDSDTDSKGKSTVVMQLDTEDQCVPVIDNKLVEGNLPLKPNDDSSNQKHNNSCEPMDIDETLPTNISSSELSQTKLNKSSSNQKPMPSSPSHISLNKSANKSKRKSSLSNSHNLEKSETENKSTLILSQLKDVSSTEHNVSKSPKLSSEHLSKSVACADISKRKSVDKKNLSQDYSTSTPLQQKRFQKLGMQINSSIIDTSNTDNKKSKPLKGSNNEMSQISKSSKSSSEDEDDLEEDDDSANEESEDKSQFLDDEADVASDDYESGDSRDDEERQYEDENEIVEKGETLDSEDDVSNDTDYEKDSFIVSSDEEDNELLSGSGDDLSMSDRELSMSKKSKKKYDERKKKEQKNASREMYEARHQLNNSESIGKSKKLKKRQQIESSEDSEEDEVVAPVKRNKHLRLDSTHDDDIDRSNRNESLTKNKKAKVKRLSESVCDESLVKEQEITANEEDLKHDPLSIQVKLEPKTPMKDLNISTIEINQNIEEVQVGNNVSIMKSNETKDPLQATMMGDEDSSMSENSEIMNNYDSVLNELNSTNKTKRIKSHDISLNLSKKTKQSLKEPIIDQLNLTKTKKQKKKLGPDDVASAKVNKLENKGTSNTNTTPTESSSDSIDLQLLFSEDSNDCEDKNKSAQSEKLKQTEDLDEFIPLKRTPGKINIFNTEDNMKYSEPENLLEESTKNKNKTRKSQSKDESKDENYNNQSENNDVQFFIDTQGTHSSTNNSINTSLTNSTKKKKNRNSVTLKDTIHSSLVGAETISDEDAPKEVPFESLKNKKKNKQSLETPTVIEISLSQDDTEKSNNISLNAGSAKKKKKRVSESHTDQDDAEKSVDTPLNVSSAKKKKKRFSESHTDQDDAEKSVDTPLNVGSAKKKKNRVSESHTDQDDAEKSVDTPLNVGSAKKKKKRVSESHTDQDDAEKSVDTALNVGSAKKKNKRVSESNTDKEVKFVSDNTLNISMDSATKKKQKSLTEVPKPLNETNVAMVGESNDTKKRKRKSSSNEVIIDDSVKDIPNSSNILNESATDGSQKKKRKISKNEDTDTQAQDAVSKKRNNKKRKKMDDDEGNSVSKIFKENSFDKVPITRLPTSFINKLEDKPSKEVLDSKKSSLVSTTPFTVEEARKKRSKPSTFLEESVYLNDTYDGKKQKGNIKKPKVLPFMPTAVTSSSGFTTNFKINIIPQEVQFVAQTKTVSNFKNDYLYGKKIKRLGTYETYKKHRNAKMSKF